MTELNVIDLFCGAGGMSYGFKKAGFNVILGIDSDKSSVDTFQKNHKDSKALCKDLKEVSLTEIRKLADNKEIDVVIGGPPCQGFSKAGRQNPNDPRNALFHEYLSIVNGLKPRFFIMENVTGMLNTKDPQGRKVIDTIIDKSEKMGYEAKYYKVNMADYGVPQKRRRVFIIGTLKGNSFSFPEPTHSKGDLSKNGKKMKKWAGLKNILYDRTEVDTKYFYSDKLIEGFKRREHQNKKRNYGFGWRFLDPDEPSYTISARYWKDGAEALIKYSEDSIRMLTPEECARIQSFPESYKFSGSRREIYMQIGNAVPPLVSFKIAKTLFNKLQVSTN